MDSGLVLSPGYGQTSSFPSTLSAARGLQDQRQVTRSAIADVYHLFMVRQAGKYWLSHR